MKTILSRLKENIAQSRSHRAVWLVSIILIAALLIVQIRGCLPIQRTIRLGIFSTSNWNVPESSTYEVVDQVIERFEADHPHTQVEYTSGIIKEDYSAWLSDQIVQGTLPDVFMILDEDFNMLASLGALKNLDPFFKQNTGTKTQDYYESALTAGQYKGAQYALPYQCNLQLMFVNTTLLDQEGVELPDWDWTLDEFAAICKQITRDSDQDGLIDQCGYVNYTWKNALEAYGISMFAPDGLSVDINNDSVRQALRYMQTIQEYDQNYYPFTAKNGFDSGKVAFAPMSYAEYKTYSPYPWKVRKYSSFEWSMLPMPGTLQSRSSVNLESLMMGISATSAHPKEAWELLKLFTADSAIQQTVVSETGGISPLRSLLQSAVVEENSQNPEESARLLDYAIENSTGKVRFKKYEEAMNLLDTGMNEILSSQEDIGLQLLNLERRINSYLQE